MQKEIMSKDETGEESSFTALSDKEVPEKNGSEHAKKQDPKQWGVICLILAVMLIVISMVIFKAFSEKDVKDKGALSETTLSAVSASTDVTATEFAEPTVQGETIVAGSDLPVAPDARNKLGFFWWNDYAVILGGENSPIYVEGAFWTEMYSPYAMLSQDHTAVAFVINVNEHQIGDLWYSDGTKAVEVAKQVGVDHYLLSNDGSTVAYVTGAEYDDPALSLYVYKGVTGVSRLVTDNAYPLLALSPKGEAIAYAVLQDDGNADSIQGYYSIQGGEPQELGKNCYGIALMDNGAVIYYYSYDGTDVTLCALHDGIETIYATCEVGSENTFIFNNDCSQVLCSIPYASSATYFSQNGGPPEKVFDSRVSLVGSEGYAFEGIGLKTTSSDFPQSNLCNYYCIYSDKAALCNQLFVTDGLTTYFDAYLQPHTVASGTSYGGFISRTENVLCYIAENSLQGTTSEYSYDLMYLEDYLNLSEDPSKPAQKIAANVASFKIGKDHTVFFQDIYETGLYVVRDLGQPQLVTEQYATMYDVANFEDSCVLYYLTNSNQTSTLFSLENKEGAIPVIVAQGVEQFTVGDYGVAYYATDSNYGRTGLYYSADGINYEWIMSRVYTQPAGA